MKLILIRHAQSERNAGIESERNGLTEKGKTQAKRLANSLAKEKIDYIFCSNAGRCIETLEEIIKGQKVEMGISFSRLLSPKMKSEEFSQLQRRIKRFIEDLRIEFEGETVAIISHQMEIRMFLLELTKEATGVSNASMSTVVIEGEKATVVSINETGFLED